MKFACFSDEYKATVNNESLEFWIHCHKRHLIHIDIGLYPTACSAQDCAACGNSKDFTLIALQANELVAIERELVKSEDTFICHG